jgi:thiamine biosynthesis lipoprotein
MPIESQTVLMMGTSIDLTVEHATPEKILAECVQLLHEYEQLFSANDSASSLNKINHQAGKSPVTVPSDLYDLIKIGKHHSIAPGSLLNITIGPLIQTWRIGFSDARVPSDSEIQSLLKLTDPHKIHLNDADQSVYLEETGMKIDLGALAKGYIADRLMDYLKEVNTQSALVNLGGNLVTLGPTPRRADGLWRIGIQNPRYSRGNSQVILKVKDQSVVTSGIYERSLTAKGETFHHIFDPKTGYPVETNIASLTIISDLSIDGEIWTTRLFGKNHRDILETIHSIDHIEGIIISDAGDVIYSEGVKKLLA